MDSLKLSIGWYTTFDPSELSLNSSFNNIAPLGDTLLTIYIKGNNIKFNALPELTF